MARLPRAACWFMSATLASAIHPLGMTASNTNQNPAGAFCLGSGTLPMVTHPPPA